MTLPDPNLERQAGAPDNVQDRVPPTERGEDPERDAMTHALTVDPSRPLSSDEKQAAEHDVPVAERVYAPASERVPKEPVPGHRDVVEHTDTDTPERHAAEASAASTEEDAPHGGAIAADAPGAYGSSGASDPSAPYGSSGASATSETEPSFTRVTRPGQVSTADTPTPSPYASPETNPGYVMPENWDTPSRPWWMPAAWLIAPACLAACAVFLYLRWQRERNKPINRIRRQANRARKAAEDLRGRVPNTTDVAQPRMGLVAALASTALVLWRRMRAQKVANKAKRVREAVPEADWQKRLLKLKERWTPGRLELEKISISKH
jgi:hypothetical protein